MKNAQLCSRQTAFNYVIYMIVGSYFRKAECRDRARERAMRFHYRQLSQREQLRMESLCIRYAEEMLSALPARFREEDVEVRFVKNTTGDDTLVCFEGWDFFLAVGGRYDGGDTKLAHRVFRRKRAKRRAARRKAA